MSADHTVLAVNRHARKIPDVLVRSGELIEQGRFAAVLIACQRESDRRTLRQRATVRLDMINTALAKPRMVRFHRRACLFLTAVSILHLLLIRIFARICRGLWTDGFSDYGFCLNFFGIGNAECQFIAMDSKLHRIAHRRQLHQLDFRARYDAHI